MEKIEISKEELDAIILEIKTLRENDKKIREILIIAEKELGLITLIKSFGNGGSTMKLISQVPQIMKRVDKNPEAIKKLSSYQDFIQNYIPE